MSHTMSQLEDRFLRIALKISAYPVALFFLKFLFNWNPHSAYAVNRRTVKSGDVGIYFQTMLIWQWPT